MQPFSSQKLKSLLDDLERHRPKGRAVAAFDADGTLWDTDLGEAFFQYQVEQQLVTLPKDPWGHYQWLKDHASHTSAYVWLAQINNGVELAIVRQWAEASVASKPLPIFAEQVRIFEKLKELEVEVYIVTASIKWAVEPGALRLGLRHENVLGIETEVFKGRISDQVKEPVTYREGKLSALLHHTQGVAPYFCSGNSEGDVYLLHGATDLRLVMSASPDGSETGLSESKMLELAKQQNWYWHRY